ncbi:hypothetical protein E2C01_080921 [Portunus trituberculatus]|uniref:Uncharacterized protein n=1 Tax=Portunus trituberculatus TaxID=210409 RepID=A0A5B7IUG1_PORTR|nr:hypothetical protein [Portunus trituberculatus]
MINSGPISTPAHQRARAPGNALTSPCLPRHTWGGRRGERAAGVQGNEEQGTGYSLTRPSNGTSSQEWNVCGKITIKQH